MKKNKDKIAICLTCHNYGKYLKESIDSVINQSYRNWELYIFLEECSDNSLSVALKYKNNNKIKIIINKKRLGLNKCANKVLRLTEAKYFTRLDADDFLHKDAYKTIINEFNKHQSVALIYTDYFYVDEKSKIIEMNSNINKLKKDNPAHGACSILLREKFSALGGYNEKFNAQDGYDLWLNFLQNGLKIHHLKKYLFYYRQHPNSLSTNFMRILNERKKINMYYSNKIKKKLNIAYVIGGYDRNNFLLKKLNKKVLLKYSIDACKKINKEQIYISTRSKNIKNFSMKNNIKVINRSKELDSDFTTVEDVLVDAKKKIKNKFDVFVFINAFNPFISADLIKQGINTLKLFNSDSVISVYEDLDLHYKDTKDGLKKLMKRNHSQLRVDRETLYVDSRMFRVVWSKKISSNINNIKVLSNIGKVMIPRSISLNVRTHFDFWLAEKILCSDKYKKGAL